MTAGGVPKVSVVIAFLDGEDFLAEAVASVMAQTLPRWELVLVDDGSADASGAWAEALAARDQRVRCLAFPGRENRGQAAAKALGADAARGEYLLFLGHDDVLYPECLATLAAALDAHPRAGLAIAGDRSWKYDPAVAEPGWELRYRRFAGRTIGGRWLLRDLLWSDNRHPASFATMFRRAEYLAARGPAAPLAGMYEDTAMLLRMLVAHDVFVSGEVVGAYRLHGGSMCQRAQAAGTHLASGGGADRARLLRWARQDLALGLLDRAVLALALRRCGAG